MNNYPYQNLLLKSLKGERWKDVPGLGQDVLISNYGRIKRLSYEIQYKNGAVYNKPERIIKPYISYWKNKTKRDVTMFLVNRVIIDGNRYNLTIARLVYYCFVETFDLTDKNINIICKDGNGLNIRPGNLIKASLSEKAKRIVERKRMSSPYKNLTAAQKDNRTKSISAVLNKKVSKYSAKGQKIKTYISITEAQHATGVFASSIGKVASGGGVSAGGYLWQWGDKKRIDVKHMANERKKSYRKKHGYKVSQYDFGGNKIAQYPSLQDAEERSGANANAIRLVIKGEYKSAKGYFWAKGYGKNKIDLSGYEWGRKSMAITQSKKVNQFSKKGKLLKVHPSVKAAAASIGVTPSVIVDCCKGRQMMSGNCFWTYA